MTTLFTWYSTFCPKYAMMTSSNGNVYALLAICAGNSPVSGEFPAQRPVTQSFDVFFDLRLNKRLSKSMLSRPLWRHCNARVGSKANGVHLSVIVVQMRAPNVLGILDIRGPAIILVQFRDLPKQIYMNMFQVHSRHLYLQRTCQFNGYLTTLVLNLEYSCISRSMMIIIIMMMMIW